MARLKRQRSSVDVRIRDRLEMIDDGIEDLRLLWRASTHFFSFNSGAEVEDWRDRCFFSPRRRWIK